MTKLWFHGVYFLNRASDLTWVTTSCLETSQWRKASRKTLLRAKKSQTHGPSNYEAWETSFQFTFDYGHYCDQLGRRALYSREQLQINLKPFHQIRITFWVFSRLPSGDHRRAKL